MVQFELWFSTFGYVAVLCSTFAFFSFCFLFDVSLTAIAKKRPAYYGRILPVLLSLDPPSFVIKGFHVYGAHHALKSALRSCLKCTHPSAAPVCICIKHVLLDSYSLLGCISFYFGVSLAFYVSEDVYYIFFSCTLNISC